MNGQSPQRLLLAFATTLASGCAPVQEERPLVQSEGGGPIAVEVYGSVGECVQGGRLTAEACRRGQAVAMTRHPRFAEHLAKLAVCESIYGAGRCTSFSHGEGRFAAPRPTGFLACFPGAGAGACASLSFAPVYENVEWGLFTGEGGGHLERAGEGGRSYRVLQRVVRRPII